MLTYTYDSDGFYMGGVVIPDRPKGVGLPAQCTITAPPADGPLWHRARWTGTAWEVAEDHRGRIGHVPGGEAYTITAWGPLPEGWIEGEPEPLPPTLEQARAAKIEAINAGYSSVMQYIQAGYPTEEVLSWERQATQARELTTDPDAEAAFVRALAATKGITVNEMCRRILANAAAWEPIAAMLTAQRQLMEEAVWAADTPDAVEAVKVGFRV